MKVGIIDLSKSLVTDLKKYIPNGTTKIVSGDAGGIEKLAIQYAYTNKLKLYVYVSKYSRFRKRTSLKDKIEIVNNSDIILIFWNGKNSGLRRIVNACKKRKVQTILYLQ